MAPASTTSLSAGPTSSTTPEVSAEMVMAVASMWPYASGFPFWLAHALMRPVMATTDAKRPTTDNQKPKTDNRFMFILL
jgi:hypothetical protein